MSLITCCPACQTMFQVSGEDLRVSDGWVRCGKCNGVFDASAHLQVMPPAQKESMTPPAAWEPEADLPVPVAPIAPIASSPPPQAPALSQPAAFSVAEWPSLIGVATPSDDIAFERPVASVEAVPPSEPSPAPLRREDRSARPSFKDEPVSFSGNHAPTRSRLRLLFWLLALAVLTAALLGWARHERQALVQRLPALLPTLDSLCRLSACEIKAPRLPDVIVIEDASMQEVAPSEYKVQLVLKNIGKVAVEPPSLRVTLTGLQGEVLASHIASPAQFAAGVTRLEREPLSISFTFTAVTTLAPALFTTPAENAPVDSGSATAVIPLAASSAAGVSPAAVATSAPAPAASVEEVPAPAVFPVSGYRVIAFYP